MLQASMKNTKWPLGASAKGQFSKIKDDVSKKGSHSLAFVALFTGLFSNRSYTEVTVRYVLDLKSVKSGSCRKKWSEFDCVVEVDV